MLIDEAAAKLKFCPLGRGVAPLGRDSAKFASGINMGPSGHITTCEGTACMLWETHQVMQEPKELPCPDCEGKSVDGCAKCGGTGKYTIQIPHHIGFCGAGFNGPNNAALIELGKGVQRLTGIVAQALKITVTDPELKPPAAPPNEEVQNGTGATRDKA